MLPTNNDKKNLIESMKKLTNHISNNSIRQKEIFDSLSINDLNKIVQNLHDENQCNAFLNSDLRRISALLLCELFYNNPTLKQAFAQKLNIQPSDGRICINGLGQSVQKYPSTLKKCLQLMKSPLKKGQENTLCWAINLDKKSLQIQYFQFKKYSSFTFLDPMRNIFGITQIDENQKSFSEPLEVPATQATIRSKIQASRSIQLDGSSHEKVNRSGIYSKKHNYPSKELDQKRPSTSRERDSSAKSGKQKNFTYVKLRDFNFYRNEDKGKEQRMGQKKQKSGTTIQAISQYARNSYIKTNTKKDRQKHSISFTQAMDQLSDSNRHKTDRRLRERNIEIGGGTEYKRSSIDAKYPQSTKNQHQNFYKRVQQILRK